MVIVLCCGNCRYFSNEVRHAETELRGDTAIYTSYTVGRCLKTGEIQLGSDSCSKFSMRDTNESVSFSESISTVE